MVFFRMFLVVSMVVALLLLADPVWSEDTCVANLNPCLPYVNDTTSPIPNTCCDPVKEAITSASACLCGYYNTPGMLESVGIMPSRVADIIRECKVDGAYPDAICKAAKGLSTAPAGSLFPDPPPSSAAGSAAGIGVCSLFLIFAYSVVY